MANSERAGTVRLDCRFFLSCLGRRLFREESGQAVTEYILLMSAVTVAAVSLARGILNGIYEGILAFGGQFEKDLKTGRGSVTIWKN